MLLPYQWVVERTNAWTGTYRRNPEDYERDPSSAEATPRVSHIHRMLRRLQPDADAPQAPFLYPRKLLEKAAELYG